MEYTLYVVTDSHGNVDFDVVKDTTDTVSINKLKSDNNKPMCFESDGYRLEQWCVNNGLIYSETIKQVQE